MPPRSPPPRSRSAAPRPAIRGFVPARRPRRAHYHGSAGAPPRPPRGAAAPGEGEGLAPEGLRLGPPVLRVGDRGELLEERGAPGVLRSEQAQHLAEDARGFVEARR